MADPICRWRNSSVKQVTEFNVLLPLKPTSKKEGRDLVEKRWQLTGGKDFFGTPYQLALQMGMYYEDEYTLYPRFSSLISLEEAAMYINGWAKKYYAPNPYTRSMSYEQKPVIINNYLVNWVYEHENPLFSEALKEMFSDNLGNTDILVNLINNFMEITIKDDKIYLKSDGVSKYSKVYADVNSKDKEQFFIYFGGNITATLSDSLPLQQIYYGAPGTGKSHEINEQTKGQNVIRTTFHPDSDYSTFVGAYKPTSIEIEMHDMTGHLITKRNPATGKDEPVMENRIIYEFVEQAFLLSYINAWKAIANASEEEVAKKQFLVIEEINRGNCAQIFGDLFQLLDRNDWGFSEYPIKADNDMKKHLKKAFVGLTIAKADEINACFDGRDIVKEVLEGECLLLPNNLYIWATMNTSDQSLFPIDSAFKRRWGWEYMPIDTAKENWAIRVNNTDYSWTSFLNIINKIVHEKTQSADKQLGFYFCKAKNCVIDAKTFVGKVLFYLWNDVFKDYGFDDDFFEDEKLPDGTFKPLAFKSFYDVKTREVIETQAEKFLKNLKIEEMGQAADSDRDDEESGVTGMGEKQLRFWQGFNDAREGNKEFAETFGVRKPQAQNWTDLSFGSSAYWPTMSVLFTKSKVRCGIWIGNTPRKDEVFDNFKANEDAINNIAGVTMYFSSKKQAHSLMTETTIDINDENKWSEAYEWLRTMALKMYQIKQQFGI